MMSDSGSLSAEQRATFARDGLVRVSGAFPAAVAEALADRIWSEFETEHGIRRDDPETWVQPARAPRQAKRAPENRGLETARLRGAMGELIGVEDCPWPRDWGGFLVTFPQPGPWDVPADTWHWDGDPDGRGLFVFTFYSTVEPGGGGTPVLAGSHRLLRAFYGSLTPEQRRLPHKEHRRMFSTWDPWLAELTGHTPATGSRSATFMERETEVRGIPCRVVELTGKPGDAVLCSPGILHAIAENHGRVPRMMRSKMVWLPDDWQRFREQAARGEVSSVGRAL